MTEKKRIGWIDGLKGLGCLMIFLHHFLLAFFPSTYYGAAELSHIQGDYLLALTPLGSLINGRFWVYIFLALSGMVISLPLMDRPDMKRIASSAFRRYFTLMIPVLGCTLLVCLFGTLNLFSNRAAAELTLSPWLKGFYKNVPDVWGGIAAAVLYGWIRPETDYNTVFWMLPQLISGAFLTYVLCIALAGRKSCRAALLMIPFLMLLVGGSYLVCFVIGYAMALLLKKVQTLTFSHTQHILLPLLGAVLILAGFFFGGYPTEIGPSGIYKALYFESVTLDLVHLWKTLGTVLLLTGVLLCTPLQRLLETRPMRFLGSVSFMLYLFHIPVIFTLSTSLFMFLMEKTGRYLVAFAVITPVTLAAVLLTSWLAHITLEKGSLRFAAFLEKKTLDKE